MQKTIWLNKAKSFKEAQKFDDSYYTRLTPDERIEAMQLLREAHFKSTGMSIGENGNRLRRVVRIIELK
jgi:hypothetical protein